MKKIILSALLLCSALKVVPVAAQRSCGQQAFFEQLEAQHPGAISRAKAMRDAAAVRAVSQAPGNIFSKTTEAPLIPVVFHIVLDAAQLQQAGGTAGIEDRIKTQLEVLNKDFNALNSDASKIPDVWKSLYANIGLRFGLAVKTESGADTKGYDIRLAATGTTFSDYAAGCPTAKKYAKGGLDPWNYNKYLNIWIVNTIVLGVTAPPGLPDFPADERGVVLSYQAFGSRSSSSQSFLKGYDKGRTLTHELGHFFHLWHTWGDDNGLCPDEPGGDDDGIADTPPEAAAAYNTPSYPLYDKCSPTGSSNGVMFMNFLDYTSDVAMYMFTTQQANVIRGEIAPGGNSWSLTQNPGLAKEPDVVPKDSMGDVIQVRPNPSSSGIFQIRYDSGRNELKRLAVYNSIGQVIFTSEEPNITSIDLSAYSKGMYILRCWFDKRTITEKIVFQ